MSNYAIRDGYQARPAPDYFADVRSDGKHWQPDIIPIAAHLARTRHVKRIIDIGCGRAAGYVPYADEFQIIGIDYGSNLEYCRNTYIWGTWLELDLEQEPSETLLFKNSVVVCSDVIEHLVYPDYLLVTLMAAVVCAECVILSTPDRERVYGYDQDGPPGNPHHVREWTLAELIELLESCGLGIAWSGWTISNNVDRLKNTCLAVCTRRDKQDSNIQIEGIFDLEKA